MKKTIYLFLLATAMICMCIGCGKAAPTEDMIVETLEEKYPEKTFEVEGQEGLYYQVVDNDGIRFEAEPIRKSGLQFLCRDNYLDAYFQGNGTLERCNEIIKHYGIKNEIVIGEAFELDIGAIDDEENFAQMAMCLDELGEELKVPFEVTYYDRGTPQQGEKYQGSSTVGTFSYISLDYTFRQPHIMSVAGEGTISIEAIQNAMSGNDFLEDIIVQINEYDMIGEALEPEFCAQIKKVVEEGERPVEVYEDDYRHFAISLEMLHAKIDEKTDSSILTVENGGKDENGNTILLVTTENGEEIDFHLGMNEGVAYSYKLER